MSVSWASILLMFLSKSGVGHEVDEERLKVAKGNSSVGFRCAVVGGLVVLCGFAVAEFGDEYFFALTLGEHVYKVGSSTYEGWCEFVGVNFGCSRHLFFLEYDPVLAAGRGLV